VTAIGVTAVASFEMVGPGENYVKTFVIEVFDAKLSALHLELLILFICGWGNVPLRSRWTGGGIDRLCHGLIVENKRSGVVVAAGRNAGGEFAGIFSPENVEDLVLSDSECKVPLR
jgi:hypothetical protein